jgi:hypothetical protein
MKLDEFLKLKTKTLENGQVLVEIEPNTWVDFESYKPKPIEIPQTDIID